MASGEWLDRRVVGGELVHDSGVLQGWNVGVAWSRTCVRVYRRDGRMRIALRSSAFMILGAGASFQVFDATPDALRSVRAACDDAAALVTCDGRAAVSEPVPAPGPFAWLERAVFTGAVVRDYGDLGANATPFGRSTVRSRVVLRLCRRWGRLRFVFRTSASGAGAIGVQYGSLGASAAAIRALREACDVAERGARAAAAGGP